MSVCAKTRHLEALVDGALAAPEGAELRSHAAQCAVCRHELNWLESEQQLFQQRAGRAHVAHLWAGVQQRTQPAVSRTRWMVGLAATLLLSLALSQAAVQRNVASTAAPIAAADVWTAESRMADDGWCSKLPDGEGFRCVYPATFLAAR